MCRQPVKRKYLLINTILMLLTWCNCQLSFAINKMIDEIDTEAATILNIPRQISPFNLEANTKGPFTEQSLKNQWTFMFFGFTSCGGICPKILTEMNKIYQILDKQKNSPLPKFVMISIDPERDTADKLSRYVTSFNREFIGARGNINQIKAMTKELGIVYMKVVSENADIDKVDYDIDHSGTILLFNPEGKLHALFSMPHDAEEISTDYKLIAHLYKKRHK